MQTEKEYLMGREINALRCESVGEYSLPDYNGDVKKILMVKAKAFPTGKFVGEDVLEFSGSVGYEVVYLDNENNVTHTEFSTDYEAALKINSESYVDSDVKTSVSGCNVRLVGPRKLMVKCSLDNDVRISERRIYKIDGDAFTEYVPQSLSSAANVFVPCFGSAEVREINEEMITLEGAIVDEVEVLVDDAKFDLTSAEPGEGSVSVKGTLTVMALLKNADQPPRLIKKEILYSEEVLLDSAEMFESIDARLEVSGLKSSVVPTEDGVCVTTSVMVTPKIYGKRNESLDLILDAYLKERGSENEYSDFGYTEHICSEIKEDSFEYKLPLSELGVEGGEIIYVEAQAKVEGGEIALDGVKVSGEIRFIGIAMHTFDDGNVNYYPVRFNAQYAQNVNINCQMHGNMRANCASDATNPKMFFDENNMYATVDVTSYVTLNADKRQRCLGASYLTDEEYQSDESVVTVYYPDASESLFGIAKRFHSSVAEIAASNKLAENVFASLDHPIGALGVKKLLIK